MAAETFDRSWMWHPRFREDSVTTAGHFVHFRKTLFVDETIPTLLPIKITADTRYKLYINKTLVAYGPVKGDGNIWFYDEIDMGPYLHVGENQIAVQVLRLFYGTSWGTSFPRLGSGGVRIVPTVDDTVWSPQIRSSTLWQTAIDPFVTLRIDEPEDEFLHVFEKFSNSDAASLQWVSAMLIQYQNSTGVTAPWKLSPRLIPHMSIQRSQFKAIHNIESSLDGQSWKNALINTLSNCNITLPAGTNHQLDLESPAHTTAFIRFRFKRPETTGARLIVTYSESYEDTPALVPYLRRKGNRLDTSKSLLGPKDIYNFQGQTGNLHLEYHENEATDEVYAPFHWRAFRFIRLNIEAGSADLTLNAIDVETVNYPLEVLSSISIKSGNNRVKELYETSIRTLHNCMHDCYEDCPFYEQLQYAMDTCSSSLFTYYVSADDRLARQAIIQLHSSFQPRVGLTASRAPSHQLQIIPHFSLYWVCMLYYHFKFHGDKEFIRPFLPVVDAVLDFFHSRLDKDLDLVAIRNDGGIWNFHDWTEEWRPYGIPPSVVKSGISTYTNNLYAHTLDLASVIQLACGNRPALSEEYSYRASQIVNAVRNYCFDGQYFTDSIAEGSSLITDRSQHNQVWAVLSGASCGEDAQSLLRSALKSSQHGNSLVRTSISMSFYTLRAISVAGGSLYNELFDGIWQPWCDQLALGLTTWEEDEVSQRSDCHAWGSAPIYEFLAEVAGVRPAEPGWEEIEFAPRLSLYPSLNATVPFCRGGRIGLAKVAWASTEMETRVTLVITGLVEPLSVRVKLPGQPEIVMQSSEKMEFSHLRA